MQCRRSVTRTLAIVLCLLLGGADRVFAGDDPQDARRLRDLSIEELMNVAVTSVAKKETDLRRSPAAILVITQDDIARLGLTSLPELLRVAAGMEVARIDTHTWAVSARGFNGTFSDKLLVLIDGRTIYEASFPGVFWDAQDLVLEDIDRIEVIRGPGATLWGTNAVNGVVNIITKHSRDTRGALVSLAAGAEERPVTSIRYGGSVGEAFTYRFFGKGFDRDGLVESSGVESADRWRSLRTGFRFDWERTSADTLTLQADYHSGNVHVPVGNGEPSVDQRSSGAHVIGRWHRRLAPTSELSMQAFYARSTSELTRGQVEDDMADVEVQHRLGIGERHDVVWGAGYRHRSSFFPPEGRRIEWPRDTFTSNLITGFVQDEIAIVPSRVSAIVGSKFERNSYTGVSWQPSARLLWTPSATQTVWSAVSRALRTPDLFEQFARLQVAETPATPTSPTVKVVLFGNRDVVAEKLVAYELGYRVEPNSTLAVDVAAFYNAYSDLIDLAPSTPRFEVAPRPHLLVPRIAQNMSHGRSGGAELTVQWQPAKFWRVAPSYTFLHAPFLGDGYEFDYASHRANVRSYVSLPGNIALNTFVSYTDALGGRRVPAYTRLDTGVSWQPTESVRVGVWGRNLLDAHHLEAREEGTSPLRHISREAVAQVVWQWLR